MSTPMIWKGRLTGMGCRGGLCWRLPAVILEGVMVHAIPPPVTSEGSVSLLGTTSQSRMVFLQNLLAQMGWYYNSQPVFLLRVAVFLLPTQRVTSGVLSSSHISLPGVAATAGSLLRSSAQFIFSVPRQSSSEHWSAVVVPVDVQWCHSESHPNLQRIGQPM